MDFRLDPIWIVQRTRRNRTHAGKSFSGPGDHGSTGWAELHFCLTTTFQRMELMSLEGAARNFDVSFIKIGAHPKRTAGSSLADVSMTNSGDY